MKYEHFKKYLLYKYYASFIPLNFIPKPIDNMSNKQLQDYLLKLGILYKYSKKSYILREEYTKECISEDKRDIGHEIAISITKQYNNDVSLLMNKIKSIVENIPTVSNNKFDIFTDKVKIEDDDEIEDENEIEIRNEIKICRMKNISKESKENEESDEEILDKIILERHEMVNGIFNILENKFQEYSVKYTMSLIYMLLQCFSLSNFDKIFHRLDNDKKKLLYDIILGINKFDFIKMIVHVRRSYIFNNDNNVDNIIHCDVKLKGENKVNPIFFDKSISIGILVKVLYIQLISSRIRETDRQKFAEIIDGRTPRLSKNLKSRNNELDLTKNAHELIDNNDILYLYVDY